MKRNDGEKLEFIYVNFINPIPWNNPTRRKIEKLQDSMINNLMSRIESKKINLKKKYWEENSSQYRFNFTNILPERLNQENPTKIEINHTVQDSMIQYQTIIFLKIA